MRVHNINREILKKTTESFDQTLFQKFTKLDQWIEGNVSPTFNQLVKYAKAVGVPFGYFFLKELPEQEEGLTIPDYRTFREKQVAPSENLKAVIKIVAERQEWAKDLLVELYDAEPLWYANVHTVESPQEEVLQTMYQLLGVEQDWAKKYTTQQQALSALIDKMEAAGIFVVVSGVVGNYNRKKLDIEEFRGFVLYDPIAPFVFVNGKDSLYGRMFTLVHEIVHVLIGKSAAFNWSLDQHHHQQVEHYCNQIAANFLVSEVLLKQYYDVEDETIYQKLARRFKVSPVVIARRAMDTQLISREQFFDFYRQYMASIPETKKGKGGNFYNAAPYKVSRSFLSLIDTAVQQGKVRPTSAYELTGLKANTYNEVTKRLKE